MPGKQDIGAAHQLPGCTHIKFRMVSCIASAFRVGILHLVQGFVDRCTSQDLGVIGFDHVHHLLTDADHLWFFKRQKSGIKYLNRFQRPGIRELKMSRATKFGGFEGPIHPAFNILRVSRAGNAYLPIQDDLDINLSALR